MRRPDRVLADSRRWNHDIHYHPVVLAAVPEGCRRALDVGCGEGQLTRELQPRVQHAAVSGRLRCPASLPERPFGPIGGRPATETMRRWPDVGGPEESR
jgi:hypothetical protein